MTVMLDAVRQASVSVFVAVITVTGNSFTGSFSSAPCSRWLLRSVIPANLSAGHSRVFGYVIGAVASLLAMKCEPAVLHMKGRA